MRSQATPLRIMLCHSLALLLLVGCTPNTPEPYQWNLPAGFPEPIVPQGNPMTEAKVQLGRTIFYDNNLSFNRTTSCATCHQQSFGFADPIAQAKGATGEVLRRNSQSLVNVAYNADLTWAHSELSSIEQQLLIPMFGENPIELGISGYEEDILSRFNIPKYNELFEEAFPGEKVSYDLMVKALASFVRSLISFNSPFDRYAYFQDDSALSESAIRGLNLFFSERLECHHCHGGVNFTQSSKHELQQLDLSPFHNTALYSEDETGSYPAMDQGLIEITRDPRDMGKFRAPTLRNVAVSAPYMHDGSIATLAEVIDMYAAGGTEQGKHNPNKSVFLHGFDITDQEKDDLIMFMYSLTDHSFLTNPDHGPPE